MRRYYETLDEAAETSGLHIAGQRPYPEVLALFTPELLGALGGRLGVAEESAESEAVAERVGMLQAGVGYAELVRDYLATVRDAARTDGDSPWAAADPKTVERVTAAATPKAEAIREFLALPENGI